LWRFGVRFPIDFAPIAVSMIGVMRAPLCVVNERRQQMAGRCQAHPRVQPERTAFSACRSACAGWSQGFRP
jgi:hypothetical protein